MKCIFYELDRAQEKSRFDSGSRSWSEVLKKTSCFVFLPRDVEDSYPGGVTTGSAWSVWQQPDTKTRVSVSSLGIWNHIRPPSTFIDPDPTPQEEQKCQRQREDALSSFDKWKSTNEPLSCCFHDSSVYRPAGRLSETNQHWDIKIHSWSLSDAEREVTRAALIKIPVLTF